MGKVNLETLTLILVQFHLHLHLLCSTTLKLPSSTIRPVVQDQVVNSTNVKTLTILGLFEMTHEGQQSRAYGESEKFAAELALRDVNRRKILDGYRLTLISNDTKSDAGVGVDAFFHALYTHKSSIISLLGSACSEVTERLAKVVPYWNIVQVSYGSLSPALSHRKEFPLFYRTVAPVSSHNDAIIGLIHQFQWDTISFLTQNENEYTMPMNSLVTDLEKVNVTVKATLTFSQVELQDQLEHLKAVDARIIVANFGTLLAPIIFCQVYQMNMWGRDYGWILIGKPERRWWVSDSLRNQKGHKGHNVTLQGQPTCTYAQLGQTVENALIVDRHNFVVKGMTSVSGMTAREFRSKFKARRLPESPFGPEVYDAVWTIALALKIVQENENLTLEFSYNNTKFSKKFMNSVQSLRFNGISGPVSFSEGDRVGITAFMQIQENKVGLVGLYLPTSSTLTLNNCSGCSRLRWHDNQIPIARRIFKFKLVHVHTPTFLAVTAVATVGILGAVAFLGFNLYNRKLKYIKLSSPRLNNVLIIGSIFAYVAVILLGTDVVEDESDFAYVCTIRAYLLSTGFSLAFGAMFAKTYRVHRIFTRSCTGVIKNKLLRDRQLMGLIFALLILDTVIITSWATFDPMHIHRQNLTLEIDPLDRSVVYQQQIKVCRSTNGNVWLSIVYGYKGLLLAVGLYMAWETRHVKIQVLNDSNHIGLCVYIVVLTSVLGGSLANLLSDKVTLSFVTVTTLIITATTATLCLLFIPKVYAILKKKHLSDPVIQSSGLKVESNTRRFLVEDTKELLFRAEVQNRVYKRQIQAIDAEMWRLEKILRGSDPQLGPPLEVTGQPELSDDGSDSSSEIFTVYLHRPRFVIPISLFNLRNGTKTIADLGSVAALAASALTGPRSSWPSTSRQSSLRREPTFGPGDEEVHRYQSEPRLPATCPEIKIELADKDSRKSSFATGTKPTTILAALKLPFTYFTGLLRVPSPTIPVIPNEYTSGVAPFDASEPKYGSEPDLKGSRASPGLGYDSTRVIYKNKGLEEVVQYDDPLLSFITTTTRPSPFL